MEGAASEAERPEAAPRFRVLRRGAWRKAFRLEPLFWATLEDMARARGLGLPEMVRTVVGEAGEDANASSFLRVAAIGYLRERRDRLESNLAAPAIVQAALAAPVACFVVSGSRSLVAHNAEFQAFVAARTGATGLGEGVSVSLSLEAPVARLIDVLAAAPGRAVACGFTLRAADAVVTGRARTSLAHPARRDLVVGYVVEPR